VEGQCGIVPWPVSVGCGSQMSTGPPPWGMVSPEQPCLL
jgi:hypothetical protein